MIIDPIALAGQLGSPPKLPDALELRRAGKLFFVGGDLPVNQTLETMFESFCMESTDLFLLSFGSRDNFSHSEEMARQIKKNFNVRLMGRLKFAPSAQQVERAYAAGVDLLDIPVSRPVQKRAADEAHSDPAIPGSVFPRWAVATTLEMGEVDCRTARTSIDSLLDSGIMPLVALTEGSIRHGEEELAALFRHLAAGWKKHRVNLKPFLPLISLTTPLISRKPPGVLRGIINKIHDRQLLVTSDLRRHLRVRVAEDSLDSAGL
jgi:hypothetical protein